MKWEHFLTPYTSEVTQLWLTLCDLMDCSLPSSSVHGIFQAIVLEWIAISFSRGSSQPRAWTQVSQIVDRCFTLWAITKVNSKWIKDLNVRPETIKLLEENIGRTLNDIKQRKILYDPPPRVMEIKTKISGTWLNLKVFSQQRKL